MSDLLQLIQEADVSAIEMEQAREGVEAAKQALEAAKERFDQTRTAFDQTIAKADDIGIPRAKLKKLIEERTSAFLGSGLVDTVERTPKVAKPKAPKKSKVTEEVIESFSDANADAGETALDAEFEEQPAYAN